MPAESLRRLDVFDLPTSWFVPIFILVLSVALYPVFAHEVPSINDLQNHLARVWILLHYEKNPAIHTMYDVNWEMLPNLAVDAFGFIVGRFVSLDLTGKLLIATTFFLILSGVCNLNRAAFGKWSAWPLLAAVFLFNRPLLAGIIGYLAGVGLYLHAVAFWVRLRNEPTILRLLCSSAFSLVVFFAHLFAFGLLGLTILGIEIERLARRQGDLPILVRNLSIAGVQFIAPLLIFVFLTPHEYVGNAFHYRDIVARFKAFGAPFLYDPLLDIFLFLTLTGIAILLWANAKVRVEPGLALGIAFLIVVQFLIPNSLFTAIGADHRIPIAACFLAIAAIDISEASKIVQFAFVSLALTVFGIRVWNVETQWASFDHIYWDAKGVLGSLPPGSKIAVARPPGSFDDTAAPAIAVFTMPVRSAIEHGGFSQDLFAIPTQNPLVLQPDYQKLARRWPPEILWRRFVANKNDENSGKLRRDDLESLRQFDYVLFATNGPHFEVQPTPLLSPVHLGRWAKIYRILAQHTKPAMKWANPKQAAPY